MNSVSVLTDRADLQDLQAILDLQYIAFLPEAKTFNDLKIEPLNQTIEELKSEYERGIVLKALVGRDRIVGSVRASQTDDTVLIRKLFVHPTMQGKGIGTLLMRGIENEFAAARYELSSSIRCPQNIRLYERIGYVRFKETQEPPDNGFVYMEKYRVAKQRWSGAGSGAV